MHAKSVLLIDNDEPQIAKIYGFLKQSVRAHRDLTNTRG